MLSKQRDEKLKAIQEREALVIKATQEAMNAEAEESLIAEMARSIFLTIEDELIEVVAARDQSRESEQKRREATLAEVEKFKATRLEAERDETARIEAARVLVEEDAIRAEAIKKQQAEDQRLASEQAKKDKTESAKAASEASSNDASRLDAVEQKMEKFSKVQEDMQKQLSSHGEMLKLILEKLP